MTIQTAALLADGAFILLAAIFIFAMERERRSLVRQEQATMRSLNRLREIRQLVEDRKTGWES